ncbi:MAG TPA: hypothetical protein VJA66_06210 [Thermoanaerobaculia bacterium]
MVPRELGTSWSVSTASVGVGVAGGWVAVVDLARWIRPVLLIDPETSWSVARLALGLFVAAGAAGAAAAAAGLFFLWSRSLAGRAEPAGLALSGRALVFIAILSIGSGAFFRGAFLARLEIPQLEDEVNLIGPALGLSGTWADFANSIRPIPYGVPNPHEMIGVIYLRALRRSLVAWGTTPIGLRFPSLAAGVISLVTGTLLGHALLPAGGGAMTALILAGMRWHFILSLTGWHSIWIAPLADLSALLLIAARRRHAAVPAFLAGLLVGLGCHLYLSAWIVSAALAAFAVCPDAERPEAIAGRARRGAVFAAGVLVAAAPLFLFTEGRVVPYFGRASRHSVFAEMRYTRSPAPLFAAAADAAVSPWLLPEPEGRHDLPDRSRLGPIVGAAVAIGLAGALVRPRRERSALFLCHAAAAFAAAVAAGHAGLPNGFRFGYLTTVTATAGAAGVLQLTSLARPAFARAAALAAVGLLAASGALGVRDALLVWPYHRATFDSFHGEDTLMGIAAARWAPYGAVSVAPRLGRSDLTIDTVRRYRLGSERWPDPASGRPRAFRIAGAGTMPVGGERIVERVRDPWGREWSVILGRAEPR